MLYHDFSRLSKMRQATDFPWRVTYVITQTEMKDSFIINKSLKSQENTYITLLIGTVID